MLDFFDRQTLDIPCPSCGHKNPLTVKWIKANEILTCAGCKKDINLQSKNFTKELKKAEKAIDDFKKEFEKIGKLK